MLSDLREEIIVFNRGANKTEVELVYGKVFLTLLYGKGVLSRTLGRIFLPFVARFPFFSFFYGFLQKRSISARKIAPFVEKFHLDPSEFLEPIESYSSFNAFFCRKLKPEARPMAPGDDVAVIPADGRYLFYQEISKADGFVVKGKKFDLESLLRDSCLAKKYEGGSMVIGRLCPTDCHRFHFPCGGSSSHPRLINGWLGSVNPMASKNNPLVFVENKRYLSELQTKSFGRILYLEIGATSVGSVHYTCSFEKECEKGTEKGYFSFGASALILLFEPLRILFDEDLLQLSASHTETRCVYGESMGRLLQKKSETELASVYTL